MMTPHDHFLFDGNYFLHRASFSRAASLGEKGPVFDSGTIVACINMIRGVVWGFTPRKATVVWDGYKSSRRVSLLETYKQTPLRSNRSESDSKAYSEARGAVCRILKKLSVRVVALPTKESDDVIEWLTVRYPGIVVVSEDRDFLQLITRGVPVYLPKEEKIVNMVTYGELFSGSPNQIVLRKCLVGDPSDNIPGVPKIGDKTADLILSQVPSAATVDDLTKALDTLTLSKSKMASLRESVHILKRNWDLVCLGKEEFLTTEEDILKFCMNHVPIFDPSVVFDLRLLGMFQDDSRFGFDGWSRPFMMLCE